MNYIKKISVLFFITTLILSSCGGLLDGADKTETYYPGDALFEARMQFLSGVWYSYYAGIGRLDGYRIRKWSDFNDTDKAKVETLFPSMNVSNPTTYSDKLSPQNNDYYIFLYDDTVYGQEDDDSEGQESWGFSYMGLVRAINIFNDDLKRGAVIIEYFVGADPAWLSWEGLSPGEKPFFGIYFRATNNPDVIQMANPVNLAELYASRPYHTEQKTLQEAININTVENEAEFISWGVVDPQHRQP